MKSYAKIDAKFTKDVLAGKFPCGELFRLAVQRSVRERKKPPKGYAFDPELADRACEFFESLPLPGEEPHRGKPFILGPWQVWLVREYAGWVDPVTKYRRWRFVSWWFPKGNGKTPLVGGIALYALEGDGGAKVYSAATSQKQARLCWEAVQDMLRLDPEMADALDLWVGQHDIKGRTDARVFEPISSEHKAIEGKRPRLGIIDELHLAADSKLFMNFKSACDKVDGSTLVTISTAGFGTDTELPGLKTYNRAARILRGEVQEVETFAVIAGADEDDDPFAEATWQKANPNLGVSVSVVGLRAAAERAKDDPAERATFLTKHLNLWQASLKAWLPPGRFQACADPKLRLEDFAGRQAFLGLDLGRTNDLTAKCLLFPDGPGRYAAFVTAYVTEASLRAGRSRAREGSEPKPKGRDAPDGVVDLYVRWVAEGRLKVTPGDAIDFGVVETDIAEDAKRFRVVEVDYDPTFAAYLATRLQEKGIVVTPVPTRRDHISPAMNEAERLVLTQALRFPADDSMTPWFFANVQADRDKGGRPFPVKESADSPRKIDGAVALMTALSQAMKVQLPAEGSGYGMAFEDTEPRCTVCRRVLGEHHEDDDHRFQSDWADEEDDT